MRAAVGGIRTLDFMDHFASAERCGSGIHEIRKFPFCCGCVGCAPIEFALGWQDVRPGNFLLFRRLSYDKKIPCGGERECVQQWVGFEPWTSWIILRVQSGVGAGSMKSGSFPFAAAVSDVH